MQCLIIQYREHWDKVTNILQACKQVQVCLIFQFNLNEVATNLYTFNSKQMVQSEMFRDHHLKIQLLKMIISIQAIQFSNLLYVIQLQVLQHNYQFSQYINYPDFYFKYLLVIEFFSFLLILLKLINNLNPFVLIIFQVLKFLIYNLHPFVTIYEQSQIMNDITSFN
ncbi:hypothetical protein FGO68_gene636 [Halteria grandinella]|uniref:Transmembrane protein n=1 Tax=Halteria grandinella TaxID=5974 RepID=A0A8J8SWY5_HALGN|nr:hypothetical protein FGO68_gene636 [Halteria grandinella]